MSGFSLFLIFLVAGVIGCCVCKLILMPVKFVKNKVSVFIYDFVSVFIFCLIYQILVTSLNFGIFRAYFTISYIFGIVLTNKFIILPLEKMVLRIYNNIRKRCKILKCKKEEKKQ